MSIGGEPSAEPARVSTDRAGRIAALGYDYAARDKQHVSRCNLCGSHLHVEVSRRDRYGYPAVLWICARCSLGFLSPRLTRKEYGAFYDSVYRRLVSAYHGRLIDAETVQEEQREYAGELVTFLDRTLPARPTSVLDIGGSTGVIAGALGEAYGSRSTVLDPAPDELAVAAEAGMETIPGFVEDHDPGGRTWDLVLLCQTVDHLLDVAGTLVSIARMMHERSHAFIDVLDFEFVLRRAGGVEGAVKIDHPFYLTRSTARAFLERAGLDPVAERFADDGHWGCLVRKGEPAEAGSEALQSAAQKLLAEIWARRAEVQG